MGAFEILVIILSIFLAIFLIVGIVIGVLLVKVSLQLKRITDKAEKTASSIETATSKFTQYTSAAAIGSILVKQLNRVKKRK
ncbi:hypothetical protein H6796_02545 [Candidatus Nomurabacteria bacterium]|nr:hypothetical protein [Candidatus Nomurabacteria bacterium]